MERAFTHFAVYFLFTKVIQINYPSEMISCDRQSLRSNVTPLFKNQSINQFPYFPRSSCYHPASTASAPQQQHKNFLIDFLRPLTILYIYYGWLRFLFVAAQLATTRNFKKFNYPMSISLIRMRTYNGRMGRNTQDSLIWNLKNVCVEYHIRGRNRR